MDKYEIEREVRIRKRQYKRTGKPVSVRFEIPPEMKEAAEAEGIELYHETDVFRRLIFAYLLECGDGAAIEDVKQWIAYKINPYLTEADQEPVDNGRKRRWEKQIDSAARIVRKAGLLTGIPRKTWELTEKGREEAEKIKEER